MQEHVAPLGCHERHKRHEILEVLNRMSRESWEHENVRGQQLSDRCRCQICLSRIQCHQDMNEPREDAINGDDHVQDNADVKVIGWELE